VALTDLPPHAPTVINKIINDYCIVLTACTAAVSFFENPALDRDSNTHPTFWPSKTVKRVRIIFENIRYMVCCHYLNNFYIN
jgi:hypothetical protein